MTEINTLVAAGVPALAVAAAWGKLQAAINNQQKLLQEIRDDVKRINGSVARHDERLEAIEQDINRLR